MSREEEFSADVVRLFQEIANISQKYNLPEPMIVFDQRWRHYFSLAFYLYTGRDPTFMGGNFIFGQVDPDATVIR